MRKFIISAALIGTTMVSVPAAAQYNQGRGYGYGNDHRYAQGIERQLDQIERRIDRLYDRRQISKNEARRLSREAEQIDRLHDRYSRNGLDRGEYGDLQRRIQILRQRVMNERRDGDRWRG